MAIKIHSKKELNQILEDIRRGNLPSDYLVGGDLSGGDFSRSDLSGINLSGADLSGGNLLGANTEFALFHYTVVEGTIFPEGFENSPEFLRTRTLPEGDIIGWKKCMDNVLVKLRIPADAPRCHAFSRKCRAAYADVLEVIGGEKGVSLYGRNKITYEVGKRAYPDSYDHDWRNEKSNGIHFYITRGEAEAH